MNVYSKAFSHMYDSLMGNYADIIHPTQKLVYEYTQKKKNVSLLELGCGTGTILKSFPPSFMLYGLDIAPGMLEVARKKVKNASFIEADMSNFSIAKKFDVIICVFDSINHLTNFKHWEKTFECVVKHLKNEGVFIFDMNTIKRLDALVSLPAYLEKKGNQLSCVKVLSAGKNLYNARFEIFKNITKEKILLHEENVYESSYGIKKIKKTLRKYYTIEKMLDPYRDKINKDTGRIFFVCKKLQIKKQSPQ